MQVKTTTVFRSRRRVVTVATRGGNQSWGGIVKHLYASRCDHLFVLASDGRRWFILANQVEGRAALLLGGPKYARTKCDRDRPFGVAVAA